MYILYKGETLANFLLPCLAIGKSFWIYLYVFLCFIYFINYGLSP